VLGRKDGEPIAGTDLGFANKICRPVEVSLFKLIPNAFAVRLRKKTPVDWSAASKLHSEWHQSHGPLLEFGDFLIATAHVGPEWWLLIERAWFGYPDPPRFAYLAFSDDGKQVAAGDLDTVPQVWTFPKDLNIS